MARKSGIILNDLSEKLNAHASKIALLQRKGKDILFKLSYELYLARNSCLDHKNEQAFGRWVEELGISRSSAYRAISRWEQIAPRVLDCPTVGQSPSFDGFLCFAKFDDSAIDELAKPSTPKVALDKAIEIANSGKGLSKKEAIELIESCSDKGEPGGEDVASIDRAHVADGPASSATAAETGQYYCCSAEFGEHEPSCPNYTEESDGEPNPGTEVPERSHTGNAPPADSDDKEFRTQKSKTGKTVEALMRCFDDLNRLRRRDDDIDWALTRCRELLQSARNW